MKRTTRISRTLGAFAVAIAAIVADPLDSAMGLGLVLIGVPVYALIKRRARLRTS